MFLNVRLRLRLLSVFAACLVILSTLAGLAYVVTEAIGSMATSADQMDDVRAQSAASGALTALKKQLGATIRDNAYWDDAYSSLNNEGGKEWAIENWGSTTADYPLYDTAMVLGADGRPIIAYHKGEIVADADAFFLGALGPVVTAARRDGFRAEEVPVAFVKTTQGIALIGAAAIQPSTDDGSFNIAKAKVLIYSKQLTAKVITEIADTFSIRGLRLEESVQGAPDHLAEINDIEGHPLAWVTWPPMHPGTTSYLRIQSTIIGSGIVVILLLAAVAACGLIAFRDVRDGERAANYKARHDALTGLWNRAGCLEKLEESLATARSNPVAFHLLDLDGFKPINDAWGHAVGDELIRAVAERLMISLPPSATVARLGGDEFAVIHLDLEADVSARSLADRILTALAPPFRIDGRTIEIGGSVGWVTATAEEFGSAEFLRRADLALYRAKDVGRGVSMLYEASLDADATSHADFEQELRQGLNNGDIRVVFQPLLDASTGEVSSVEALARWTSPSRGPVSPDVFIAVAEKAGLVDQLGFQVLNIAIREAAHWQGIGVAVNISPLQLRNPFFVRQTTEALAAAKFDPTRLTIEVTEGVLISNPEQAKRAFNGLRELGVKIALDDFGCGYASIGTLREFGFDSMKIDRSLILAANDDENGCAVLRATVALANALHLPVTAEGIETEEQATIVRMSGCNKLQGYLFSKPVSAGEITDRYFGRGISTLRQAV